ncbi:DUF1972 domain-containing protein [Fictibacillus nanhaiensis]|uniref:beta 1-4 rhamnosyltransferase Cps2T n=1 Tax=Fictibacillus nanhaiensis TaxID=742169 RepID=UPI002E1B2481|nr:DUF1972 domain-containing protein [Fictibacillus nanhaiensis]
MRNIFIIGSKGIPSRYGGFETFVDKLTEYKKTSNIKYHVACLADDEGEFEYNEARCFKVKIPEVGAAKAVLYDIKSLDMVLNYIKKNNIKDAIVYILACRIGPFMGFYKKKFEKLGIPIFVNPDGHEWMRSKWNIAIRKYWKYSERLMVKYSDLLICDSRRIEDYIKNEYVKYQPNTTFIAYGANLIESKCPDEKIEEWYCKHDVKKGQFHLVVGRFVPENNYELFIKEFMRSETKKDLVLITNVENNKFYKDLNEHTGFEQDKRIKFVGTVYDGGLLKRIREEAYGYIHGHEVGGTNPSLLEAMASTKLNLLLDVSFNREVGQDAAYYFSKKTGNLAELIDKLDYIDQKMIIKMGEAAISRIQKSYTWPYICNLYETLWNQKSG